VTYGDQAEVVALAETFGKVARLLAGNPSTAQTLQSIVDLAVQTLHGCEHAGISYVEGRLISSPASTGEVPRVVDRIQTEVDEGPCLDAIRAHEVFQTGDLAAEGRWPRFANRAHAETGIRSVLSLRLFVEEDTMGALNLYSTQKDAFDETDEALGSVFAAHAAVALSAARKAEQLEQKASSREVIGRAKGILMAQGDLDADQAFDILRRASQRLNLKVVDIATRLDVTHGYDEPVA
jgi:transcriptional regulator with GAF, ATPase, and Fis domain